MCFEPRGCHQIQTFLLFENISAEDLFKQKTLDVSSLPRALMCVLAQEHSTHFKLIQFFQGRDSLTILSFLCFFFFNFYVLFFYFHTVLPASGYCKVFSSGRFL